jgi:hypothetical protein
MLIHGNIILSEKFDDMLSRKIFIYTILGAEMSDRKPYIEYIVAKLPSQYQARFRPRISKLVLSAKRINYAQRLAAQSVDDIKRLVVEGEKVLARQSVTMEF